MTTIIDENIFYNKSIDLVSKMKLLKNLLCITNIPEKIPIKISTLIYEMIVKNYTLKGIDLHVQNLPVIYGNSQSINDNMNKLMNDIKTFIQNSKQRYQTIIVPVFQYFGSGNHSTVMIVSVDSSLKIIHINYFNPNGIDPTVYYGKSVVDIENEITTTLYKYLKEAVTKGTTITRTHYTGVGLQSADSFGMCMYYTIFVILFYVEDLTHHKYNDINVVLQNITKKYINPSTSDPRELQKIYEYMLKTFTSSDEYKHMPVYGKNFILLKKRIETYCKRPKLFVSIPTSPLSAVPMVISPIVVQLSSPVKKRTRIYAPIIQNQV
jgi:hypothetical protein